MCTDSYKVCCLLVSLQMILICHIKCDEFDGYVVKPHKKYNDLNCYHPVVTSMTRMRDNFYFLSTYDKRFWFISESDEANDKNSRKLETITTYWLKIDASLYYG